MLYHDPSSAIFCARLAKAAARSICPAAGFPGFPAPPPGLGGALGLGADVIGGLPPAGLAAGGLGGTPGFAATGGGFGLFAIGGGLAARELAGLELAGVLSDKVFDVSSDFFQGIAEPLDGPMPGKTDTGLADESATTDLTTAGAGVGPEAMVATAGVVGGGRRFGGGGGATAAFGLGGTSSR